MELALILLTAAIALWIYRSRKKKRVAYERRESDEVECVVVYQDRRLTLPQIEACFKTAGIRVMDTKRHMKRTDEEEVCTDIYKLSMSPTAETAMLVGSLTSITTVQSVRMRQIQN